MARDPHKRALLVVLLLTMVLVALIVRPLAEAILVGAVLAAVLWPAHRWLTRALKGRSNIAAALVMLALLLLVLGPLVGLSTFIVQQAVGGIQLLSEVLGSQSADAWIRRLPDAAEQPLRRWLEGGAPARAGSQAVNTLTATLVATGTFFYQTVMALIAATYFLTTKEQVIDWLDEASPLEERQTRELLAEVRRVSVSVVRSIVLTAGVQSLVAAVGYLIAGVPYWAFFTALTFFVAMIPAVGGAFVCLVAAAILFALGNTVGAVFLAIWGLLVVGLSDNVVKPLLMKNGVRMHTIVVLFALLGGLATFGPIGLLVGPLGVATFVAVLRIYRRDYGGEVPGGGPIASHADLPRA